MTQLEECLPCKDEDFISPPRAPGEEAIHAGLCL